MKPEMKTLTFRVKDLGILTDASGQEFGQIEAYGAMFNNVDEGGDRILPGAFKRTLKNSKERAASRQKKYLVPMLWQHDPKEMIGGWYAIEEDTTGLRAKGDINLATQRGREYYALAKAGMSDEFSIVYDIPAGGAKYDKAGVRDLSEMRLFSVDPVTWAMNDATYLVSVKASGGESDGGDDSVTICGNTKGPIGPRDEAWDGTKAEQEIWAVAYDKDSGEVKAATAKKYFMVLEGDGTRKGDYSYPFWNVGADPHINVGAVKAIAAAIQGSRGASAPDGLKPKIESLYKRINAKYPDDPQLTPPWKDDESSASDEKGGHMPRTKAATTRQRKTFEEHYNESQCRDLLRDWQDVVLCAFTSAVYDAFTIGDEPEADVNDALNALRAAVSDWVEEAAKYGLSDYLDAQSDTYDSGASYQMQHGSSSGSGYGYGYLSRPTPPGLKAMMAGDATTGGFTADQAEKLRGAAEDAKNAVDKHVKAMHDAAKSVKAMLKGKTPDAAASADDTVSGTKSDAKAGRAFSAAHEKALADHAESLDSAATTLDKAMTRHLGTMSSVADDLATVLQGSEAAYTTDAGTPEDGQQEGKSSTNTTRRASSATQQTATQQAGTQTRAPHTLSSRHADTVSEEDIARALSDLRTLRTPAKARATATA